ncbi:MAG: two-component sensor histidine kinase [Rhodobacterales bacterium]|nr:MAG: two-component sensor histidine kinase [Rhodobacterales bacterium]
MAMLLFDLGQLTLLLYLTGGLHNPFSMLLMVPVTVASMALSMRAALLVGAATVTLTSLLGLIHMPLRRIGGTALTMPEIFLLGHWVAIVIAVGFVALYTRRVSTEMQSMSQALLATQMALAREQKLTDLGGVVAAYAHELGTPLATIKLVGSELAMELDGDLQQDAQLISEQADRCRDILHSMGRAGKDDLHLRQAPVGAVLDEAAEPHLDRGKKIIVELTDPADQPVILRRPEVIHGLRNMIQNAVDFAASMVWIEATWTDRALTIRVIDDGRGYAPHLIGRLGDPFLRRRKPTPENDERPGYEGMGLGMFIAKTLLERTGARLRFVNGAESFTGKARPGQKTGAIAEITWPRGVEGIEVAKKNAALGENLPFRF